MKAAGQALTRGLSQARAFCTSVLGSSLSRFQSNLCIYCVPEMEYIFELFSRERC